jgi:hypothetical protein
VAPVGGQHEIEPQMARRLGESTRLITSGLGNEQNTGHSSMLSTAQHEHPRRIRLTSRITVRPSNFLQIFIIQTRNSRV